MTPTLRLVHTQILVRLCCDRSIVASLARSAPVATARRRCSLPPIWESGRHTSSPSQCTHFSTSRTWAKKGGAKAQKVVSHSNTDHIPDNKAQSNRDRDIDPYDFSELEAKIRSQVSWLRESLQKLRSGGRLSPDTIEALPVEIKHGLGGGVSGGQHGKKMEKLRLGDLATVVPKGGRSMAVLATEEAVRRRRLPLCSHSAQLSVRFLPPRLIPS